MIFNYKATDHEGRILTGSHEAASEDAVVSLLHTQGLIPIRIGREEKDTAGLLQARPADWARLADRTGARDVVRFTQDMTTLLLAGLPLDRALSITADATDKPVMKKLLHSILQDVKEGQYLSDALSKHPRTFSEFYTNLVRSGEAGGVLEKVLDRLGQFLETSQELKDYVVSAMIYPLFVLTIGGVSIIILLTFVIPKFAVIFADMGAAVPLATRALLGLAGILRQYAIPLMGLAALMLLGLRRFTRSPAGKLRLDQWRLEWPVLKRLTRTLETARFSRTLGTLIGSGIPILEALAMSRNIVSNRVMAQALDGIRDRVKEGERLAGPMAESGLFPSLATHMIQVGEETGQLDAMLLKIGTIYDEKLRRFVKRLINLLEPGMILVMGIVVGFIVIAMLTAIFSMNELPF